MNYYNPYISYPFAQAQTTRGIGSLFGRAASNFSFSGLLNGVQRTLNIVNQTIPVVKQIGPVMKNAKTMFKVMNEFKKIDTPNDNKTKDSVSNKEKNVELVKQDNSYSGPTFFI